MSPSIVPRLIALVAVLLVLAPGTAIAKKKKKADHGIIEGTVTGPTGDRLAGASVVITGGAGFRAERSTDADGRFEVEIENAEGAYSIHLEAAGHAPFDAEVVLAPGQRQTVELRLLDAEAGRRQQAVALYNEGVAAHGGGDMAAARAKFEEAIAVAPELAEPHLALADVAAATEDWETAAAAADRFLERIPADDPQGFTARGQHVAYEAHRRLGHDERAAELRAALAGTLKAAELAARVYNEGVAAHGQGDAETAIAKFNAALELDPSLAAPHSGLAVLYYNLERFDEALTAVEALLAMEPEHVQGRRIRYLVWDARGNAAEAAGAFEAYREVDEAGAVGVLYQRAELDFRAGEHAIAQAALRRILEIDPDMPRAHYTLGLSLSGSDPAAARLHLEKFIALAPDDPEVTSAREMLEHL